MNWHLILLAIFIMMFLYGWDGIMEDIRKENRSKIFSAYFRISNRNKLATRNFDLSQGMPKAFLVL